MKMIELFAGSGKLSNEFKKNGWEIEQRDILTGWDCFKDELPNFKEYDFVWGGNCCRTYSLAAGNLHRYKGGAPKSEDAKKWDAFNTRFFKELAESGVPYIIENPRGHMKNMDFIKDNVPYIYTVNYCCFGDKVRKPTNLFTNINLDKYLGNYKFRCGHKVVSFVKKVANKDRSVYCDGFVKYMYQIVKDSI